MRHSQDLCIIKAMALKVIALSILLLSAAAFAADGPTAVVGDIADMAAVADEARHAATTNRAAREAVTAAVIRAWHEGAPPADAIPLEGVSFPLSSYPDGSVRIQFKAAEAFLPQDPKEYVRGNGIYSELFRVDGSLEGVFVADNCIFDRAERAGFCPGQIRLQYRNLKITGTNMVWDIQAQDVKITDGARVTVNRLMGGLGKAFRK